jgi:beta-mannosidase
MKSTSATHAANGKIMNYLAQTFLYPGDFETMLYASQLLQAEAIRYGVSTGAGTGAAAWARSTGS